MCHMHRHWVTMAISALPYVGNALRPLATSIVNQTCRNLELLAVEYTKRGKRKYELLLCMRARVHQHHQPELSPSLAAHH